MTASNLTSGPPPVNQAQPVASKGAYVGLGFLTLVSAFNYLDRSLLGLALPAIKAEMHISDTALGLVSGIVFLLFYSIMGVPIAWAADRFNRRNIIAAGLAFWSLMTVATGWVMNVWQLARCIRAVRLRRVRRWTRPIGAHTSARGESREPAQAWAGRTACPKFSGSVRLARRCLRPSRRSADELLIVSRPPRERAGAPAAR